MSGLRIMSLPAAHLYGRIRVPGDKSISHRAAILGAIAQGRTGIRNFLESRDCLATVEALRMLGVDVKLGKGHLGVAGVGLRGLKPPSGMLDCGNSGTAARLLAGVLCGQNFSSVLGGDSSLSRRPMQRITAPLKRMGADVRISPSGTLPITIQPVSGMQAIHYALPIASAQLKSCLLFAALYANGETTLTGRIQTRDHTEKILDRFACPVTFDDGGIKLSGGSQPRAADLEIPGDISSAAFFMVAASVAEDAELLIEQVGVNPTRTGVLRILKDMGANIKLLNRRLMGSEPVADVLVRSSSLKGIDIPHSRVADAIDEFPVLFVAAACAEGETSLSGAEELRAKESDRIAVMVKGLRACGVDVQERPDGLVVEGGRQISAGRVDSCGDHRVAMAFIVAGSVSRQGVVVDDCANIDTSFPGFAETAAAAGFNLEAGS